MKYCELTLTWEKGRRLKSASNGSESVTYTYDAFGMRRSKTVGGSKTEYVYEKGKLIREIRGSEKIDYLYGEDGIIGIKIGNEKYLYRKNVFGDVTEIYNEEGTLVGKYNYNAFGECEIETDEGGIAEKNAIRYRGYYYDEETGFYYLKTRYYDPEIGRFITIDDTSYLAPDTINGLNLYAYCGNNPVMNVDPEGNSSISMSTIVDILSALFEIGIGGTFALVGHIVKNAPRPNNIGIGIFNKYKTAYLGKLSKAANVLGKISTTVAIISTVISVMDGIKIGIDRGYSTGRIISNTITDTLVLGGTTFALGAIGGKIGGVAGSVLPGLGNVIGAVVGFALGIGIGLLLDLQINGKSILDHIRDGDILFGGGYSVKGVL